MFESFVSLLFEQEGISKYEIAHLNWQLISNAHACTWKNIHIKDLINPLVTQRTVSWSTWLYSRPCPKCYVNNLVYYTSHTSTNDAWLWSFSPIEIVAPNSINSRRSKRPRTRANVILLALLMKVICSLFHDNWTLNALNKLRNA